MNGGDNSRFITGFEERKTIKKEELQPELRMKYFVLKLTEEINAQDLELALRDYLTITGQELAQLILNCIVEKSDKT